MRPTTEYYAKGDHRPRIGERVRIEGVVVGCEEYGVNVRLPDGTIQGFADADVMPARPQQQSRVERHTEAFPAE